jgi:hypothetical protein
MASRDEAFREKSELNQGKQSIDEEILKFLAKDRRGELSSHLDKYINNQYNIYYTSNGYTAKSYNSHYEYLADRADPGKLYEPSKIAIGLEVPQVDVQAALYRLMNTLYLYKDRGKYGVTPKYFADHPEIYNVKDIGMAIQKKKDQADQLAKEDRLRREQAEYKLKRQREQAAEDAKQAAKDAKDAEKKHIKKEKRKLYKTRMIVFSIVIIVGLLLIAYNLDPTKGGDEHTCYAAFLFILFSLFMMVVITYDALKGN